MLILYLLFDFLNGVIQGANRDVTNAVGCPDVFLHLFRDFKKLILRRGTAVKIFCSNGCEFNGFIFTISFKKILYGLPGFLSMPLLWVCPSARWFVSRKIFSRFGHRGRGGVIRMDNNHKTFAKSRI